MAENALTVECNGQERHRTGKRLSSFNVNSLDAEKVLTAFGKFGNYQMFAYFLLIVTYVLHSADVLIMNFIAETPIFECRLKEAEKDYTVLDKCHVIDSNNETTSCNNFPNATFWFNETVRYSTLNSEFNLVCDDEHWAEHGSSLFMFGTSVIFNCVMLVLFQVLLLFAKVKLHIFLSEYYYHLGGMIATPLITHLSDAYGRRHTFLVPLWISVIANVACAVSPTYSLFLFFRFLAGLGTTGCGAIGWVLCCESVAAEFRSYIPFVSTFTWVLGIIMVGVLRIWIKNWRTLYFVISAPGILTVFYYWLLPESLHWMITHGKEKAIRKYMKRSIRYNNVEICLPDCISDNLNAKVTKQNGRVFLQMLKNKHILFHLMIQCVITIIMNVSYWGLAFLSNGLSEDGYTGYFLSAFVEIPAGVISVVLLIRFGRRTITFWSFFLQGAAMSLAILYPGYGPVQMIFPIAAKTFNCIVWSSQPLLIAEMMPTPIRNTFYGWVQFFGESGSVLAPYLEITTSLYRFAPQAIVAVISVVGALLTLTAPETKGKTMPDDFEHFDPGCLFRKRLKINHNTNDKSFCEKKLSENDQQLLNEQHMKAKHTLNKNDPEVSDHSATDIM